MILGREHRLTVVHQHSILASMAATGVLAEDHSAFDGLDRESAEIEELVMQCAQRQPVRFDVWPADVMPLNMSGLQSGRHVTYA